MGESSGIWRLAAVAFAAGGVLAAGWAGLALKRWSDAEADLAAREEAVRHQEAEVARTQMAQNRAAVELQRQRARLEARRTELRKRVDDAWGLLAETAPEILARRETFDASCAALEPAARAHCDRLLAALVAVNAEMKFAELIEAGQAEAQARRYDAAIALYEEALAMQPDDAVAINFIAYAHFRADRLDDADRHVDRALDLDETNAYAWLNRVKIDCAGGRRPAARRHMADGRRATVGAVQGFADVDGEFARVCAGVFDEG